MRKEGRMGLALASPALALMAVFALFPVGYAFWTSLHASTPFAREFVGLEHYASLLREPAAGQAAAFTLIFVAASVTLELLVGLGLALLMDGVVRGRGLLRAVVLVPWAIPTVVAGILWKLLLNDQYGLVNLALHGQEVARYQAWLAEPWSARAAIVVADVWKTSGFVALLLLAGLQSIPEELQEAARVDGAGPCTRFLRITLPLLRPALLVALLFRTVDAFRVFDLVYVMTYGGPAGSTSVLPFYAYQRMFPEQRFGYGSAVAVAVFALAAAASAVLVRALARRSPA
jgi:multiple sugar transport system permease protein